jgi:hypothetical protein
MKKRPLVYDDPLKATLLRRLAWETYIAKPEHLLRVKDVTGDLVTLAREELGFSRVTRGPSSDLFREMLKEKLIIKKPMLKPAEAQWENAWRLLNLPSHSFVRQLSDRPIVIKKEKNADGHLEFILALRNPALPRLHVFTGTKKPKGKVFGARRGIYFLRLPNSLYVGKSDEFDVRFGQHLAGKKRETKSWVFITPQIELNDKTFTLDALGAAESLLISFWNEVCVLENGKGGADQEPGFAYLQQAILFVVAASAALIWLMREPEESADKGRHDSWNNLFKKPSAKNIGGKPWPECYLEPPLSVSAAKPTMISTIPIVSSPQ